MKHKLTFLLCVIVSVMQLRAQSPKYELRAAWIATFENIDWPSKRNLMAEEQRAEFIRILDMHQQNGMNAVIMQIRPVADAFFPSPFEPWSQYLSGIQGKAPVPYYDPLAFMIEETHKRGMEFHAWINPYRAVANIAKSSIAPNHITKQRPEWFINYGTTKYFDPGNPEARQYVVEVVKDIVSRYDVDAIHMDDYFYPYKIPGKDFPDNASYRQYGNDLSKENWRRSNCDSIIRMLSDAIHTTNPKVKFGISPFGVWRNITKDPRGSATKAMSNYDDLYADILLWLEKGWIDYVAPQLYWEVGHPLADFEVLVKWWNDHLYGKHLYIGQAIYRANSNNAWSNPNQLPRQINILRSHENVHGSIYFSSKSFRNNPNGWNDSLQNNYYRKPALIKTMNWLDSVIAPKPQINMSRVSYDGNNLVIHVNNIDSSVRSYAIYYGNDNRIDINNTSFLYTVIPASVINKAQIHLPEQEVKAARYLKITAISTTNHESEPEDIVLLK